MSDPKYKKTPTLLYAKHGRIAQLPYSGKIGYPAIDSANYLRDFLRTRQLFTYSGPVPPYTPPSNEYEDIKNPHVHHNIYYNTCYHIILHSPVKTDTANPERQLGGAILPWAWAGNTYVDETWYDEAWVNWLAPGTVEPDTIWEGSGLFPVDIDLDSSPPFPNYTHCNVTANELIMLHDTGDGTARFEWEPESSTSFYHGVLETNQICVAALTLWDYPDDLVDYDWDQVIAKRGRFAPGQLIRGYAGSGVQNYGKLIHMIGNPDEIADVVLHNSIRCLLQSGHPLGIMTQSDSYVNIRGADSAFRISVPNYTGEDGTITALPAVVASMTCTDTTGWIKYESRGTSDTWEVEISGENPRLYGPTDGETSDLDVSIDATLADNYDEVEISIKCDSTPSGDGGVVLHTYSLWGDAAGVTPPVV